MYYSLLFLSKCHGQNPSTGLVIRTHYDYGLLVSIFHPNLSLSMPVSLCIELSFKDNVQYLSSNFKFYFALFLVTCIWQLAQVQRNYINDAF